MRLLPAGGWGATARGRGRLLRARWVHFLDHATIGTGCRPGDKDRREEAEEADYDSHYPGTFLQCISRLFDAHQLVAETADIPCEAAAFGILDQDDPSKNYTGQYDQDHKKDHVNEYLIVRFWLQNTRFFQD
jgi:hypothetical protein